MGIDPSRAIGASLGERELSWDSSDVLLYHLGVGAGRERPLGERELRYVYEKSLRVLPTFAVVAHTLGEASAPELSMPGVDVDLAAALHGGQELAVHAPIPAEGKAVMRSRIADVHDKGKAAVIVMENEVVALDDKPLFTTRTKVFARGEGGFGGERGPSEHVELPQRGPDATLDCPTSVRQALVYRLSGDRNPLHVDPDFAATAGFEEPILHGLCSYGVVCKAVVDELLDGDPTRVRDYAARFAGVVYPGETIRVRVWQQDGGRLLIAATVVERDEAPVLADTVITAT